MLLLLGEENIGKAVCLQFSLKFLGEFRFIVVLVNDKKQESLKKLQNDKDEGEFKSLFLCGQI